ncbi:hypothetical protein AUC68_14760 [Methyloceanibacter methanicus]|uniref:UDP-hexose transferase n=1 Tax=Methyloceanibacter methanicus TaxID=1774968 RepID=A0A1E3W458_9HYPH|nr:WecB/TagA/CpsF family glycosyltransferase [Methyloceanibacter methanicus]ODS00520.1 hypothetical protein AUC68_14760 [Methyloceanibacter methanicus]
MTDHVATTAAPPQEVSRISIGGLPVAVIDRQDSARFFVDAALKARLSHACPYVVTSANGHVLSMCAADSKVRELFLSADMINADGMPLVFASRLRGQTPLPERVATTDLFHDVAQLAQKKGVTFFLLGASEEIIKRAVAAVRKMYPDLHIAGFRHGFLEADEEEAVVEEINKSGADILWVGMGTPRELEFALRWRSQLNVGVVKTSGGLFDFLSGQNRRAPQWMQDIGFEWLYRLWLEPRRLFPRYAVTNVRAVHILALEPISTVTPLKLG